MAEFCLTYVTAPIEVNTRKKSNMNVAVSVQFQFSLIFFILSQVTTAMHTTEKKTGESL